MSAAEDSGVVLQQYFKKKSDDKTGLLTVLTLLVILLIALEYASLHAKYDWLYTIYDDYMRNAPAGTKFDIGPTRIALAYERPWVANTIMSRPLNQTGAEFLLKLIKVLNIPGDYLTGTADINILAPTVADLNAFVGAGKPPDPSTWENNNNALYMIGKIPYHSQLVQGYYNQINSGQGGDTTGGDLSLMILWLYGYEEYVRERFTWSATSVLEEWNYMFALTQPAPSLPPADGCKNLATGIVSSGTAWAGIGAMIGSSVPVLGTALGAAIGFVGGAAAGLIGKGKCL
jgi:hypothetical protein